MKTFYSIGVRRYFLSLLLIAGIALVSNGQSNNTQTKSRVGDPSKQITGTRGSLATTDLDGAVTPTTLVENILGPGITYSNVTFTGSSGAGTSSAGTFTGGTAAGLDFNSGIVLSSGYIQNAIGPNSSGSISQSLGIDGDADLTALSGFTTYDATILEFDFELEADSIFIQFIFASEEYNEYVGTEFNDVFAFILDGTNIALVPGSGDPVSVNTINNGSNSSFYIDNTAGGEDIECDGYTVVLTGKGALSSGPSHNIKLAIADAGDRVLDSWVFIQESSFYIPIAVELGPDVYLCEGETAILDAGNPGYAYTWSTGETTQTIEVSEAGTYWVEVSYLGNSESDTVEVFVNPLPVAEAGEDQVVYFGYEPAECVELSATGGVYYTWSPADGLDDPYSPTPTACPTETTTYTVTVTDENGCTDTDEVTVEVIDVRCGKKMNKVLVCHVPPGNPGNAHTICVAPAAVPAHLAHGDYLGPCMEDKSGDYIEIEEEHAAFDVNVYPNPFLTTSNIDVHLHERKNVTIKVTDMLGRSISTVHEGVLESGDHKFQWTNSSERSDSMYYILVITDDEVKTIKLLSH
jgi:hypothetical protein